MADIQISPLSTVAAVASVLRASEMKRTFGFLNCVLFHLATKMRSRNLIKYPNWPPARRVQPQSKAAGLKGVQNSPCLVACLWAMPCFGPQPSICLPILSVYSFSSFFVFQFRTHLSAPVTFIQACLGLGSKLGIQKRCQP